MTTEPQPLDVLGEFAHTVLADFPIQAILEHLVRRIVEVLPISGAGVTVIASSTRPSFLAASDATALHYERLQIEMDDGPSLEAYKSGRAVAVPNLAREPRFDRFGPEAIQGGLAAMFTFPLRYQGEQLGALDLYRDTPGPLDAYDMETAQMLADMTTAYLVNAATRHEVADLSARAHENASHDALTGLANRGRFLERLEDALDRGQRSDQLVAVLLVDLDAFNGVNESCGQQVGDDVLITVARRIEALLETGDTVARLSGDEFAVVTTGLDDEMQAEVIALRLVEAVRRPLLEAGATLKLSASVGIACVARGRCTAEALLRNAEVAMHQIKRKGGSGHQLVDVREQSLVESRDGLTRDLDGAAQRGELRVVYQPVVSTIDGSVIGAEALLRWDHPAQGAIPPTTLIPLAERSRAIVDIGRWVLERACRDRRRFEVEQGANAFVMAVNVSVRQIMESGFASDVRAILRATRTPARLVSLEITETSLLEETEWVSEALQELKQIGVLIALDDFGTGYSSLSHLKRFPIDIVKLDQSFVSNILKDTSSHVIVSKIIELAHELDLAVVTEGVETVEQRDELASLDSEYCQGFYFARPMSADLLRTLMKGVPSPGHPRLPAPAA
jgi:diguanylate cyclase (GGDEF)-like protein